VYANFLTRDQCWHCIAHQRQIKNTTYAYSGQVNQKQLESSYQCVHVYTVWSGYPVHT